MSQTDAELLDILEPHYVNMGFAWGEEAREAAKKSVTYKQLKARDAAIRIDTIKVLKSRTSSHISLRSNRPEQCVLEATLDDYVASVELREDDQAKEEG